MSDGTSNNKQQQRAKGPATPSPVAHIARAPLARRHPDVILSDHTLQAPTIIAVPKETPEPLSSGVVARGKTVHASTGKKVLAGYDKFTGAPVERMSYRTFKPGQVVMLAQSEIARLKQLGFLVDPDRRLQMPPEKPRQVQPPSRPEPPPHAA